MHLFHLFKGHALALTLFTFCFSGAAFATSSVQRRAPIVFAHGLGIVALPYEKLLPFGDEFKKNGFTFHVAQTPFAGTIEERARILAREVSRLVPEGPFHLVGHSMGGLDARLAVSKFGLGDRCLSVTTLATPHRGSPVADLVLREIGKGNGRVIDILNRLFFGSIDAAHDLTSVYLEDTFNREVIDDPRVKYYSFGFYVPAPVTLNLSFPLMWITHAYISHVGYSDNDGMVSVESSKWGEYLGTFVGDHYSETGPLPTSGEMVYSRVVTLLTSNLARKH